MEVEANHRMGDFFFEASVEKQILSIAAEVGILDGMVVPTAVMHYWC